MYAITDRQQRIWEQIYSRVFVDLTTTGKMATMAHKTAIEVADNAIGRLIADGLPVEQLAAVDVVRFKYVADSK